MLLAEGGRALASHCLTRSSRSSWVSRGNAGGCMLPCAGDDGPLPGCGTGRAAMRASSSLHHPKCGLSLGNEQLHQGPAIGRASKRATYC